ncbi:MAG: hypothetical protein AAF682_11625 [Planctomycetota bacterium]
MAKEHQSFLLELLMKIGAPIFAGTLVGCILREEVRLSHALLLAVGLGLVYFGHRVEHHRGSP